MRAVVRGHAMLPDFLAEGADAMKPCFAGHGYDGIGR
jgi:hypothetical protein